MVRLLDLLRDENLERDTIVVYTSDQGFFLGDHGWYDKRFMFEESLVTVIQMMIFGVTEVGGVYG